MSVVLSKLTCSQNDDCSLFGEIDEATGLGAGGLNLPVDGIVRGWKIYKKKIEWIILVDEIWATRMHYLKRDI